MDFRAINRSRAISYRSRAIICACERTIRGVVMEGNHYEDDGSREAVPD